MAPDAGMGQLLSGTAGAVIALVAAVLIGALVLLAGPGLADALLDRLGIAGPAASEALFTLTIFGPLLVVAVAAGALWGVHALAPGERAGRWGGIGLAIGLGGVSLALGYAALAGTARAAPGSGGSAVLLLGALVVLVQVLAEEAMFRGWLQPVLARAWGVVLAVVVTTLAFVALHVAGGARSPVTLANLLLGGLVFGTLAALGRGIAGAVAMHWGWNGAEQLLFGLDPNPGVGGFGAWWDFELTGAGLWGGSAEGLNASLGMTAVLLAVLLPLAAVARSRYRKANTPARRGWPAISSTS